MDEGPPHAVRVGWETQELQGSRTACSEGSLIGEGSQQSGVQNNQTIKTEKRQNLMNEEQEMFWLYRKELHPPEQLRWKND